MPSRILLIGNDPLLQEVAGSFPERFRNFLVDSENCAHIALKMLYGGGYDAIVPDSGMPGIHGIDFLKILNSRGDTPITGKDRKEIAIEVLNHGAAFHIQKDGDIKEQIAELVHKVKQAVGCIPTKPVTRKSARLNEGIYKFLPDPAIAIDDCGKLILWNQAAEEMTGTLSGTLLGKGEYEYSLPFYGERRPLLLDFILNPDHNRMYSLYKVLACRKNLLVGECTAGIPDGRTLALLIKAAPLYDETGNIAGAIETVHDITDRKRILVERQRFQAALMAKNAELQTANVDLERSQQALVQANRTLGLVITVTRHDIKNQLMVAQGYLALSRDRITDPTLVLYMKKMGTALTSIGQHIHFTRDYSGLGVCNPEWQNVDEVFRRAREQIPHSEITFVIELELLEIYADHLLVKVFSNLIDNSWRHGKTVDEVRLWSRRGGEDLFLVYEDNGVGIPYAEKDQVFLKGFGMNTGFGLSFAKEILQVTGISIIENGEPDKGARFEMKIPAGSFRFVPGRMNCSLE